MQKPFQKKNLVSGLCRMALLVPLLLTRALAAPEGAAPSASAAQALQHAVRQWVAQQQAVALDRVTMAALDPRLKVRACSQALQMDTPFSSPETVRVRCGQPGWQLFVQVSVAGGAAPPAPLAATVRTPPLEQRRVLLAAVPLARGTALDESHVSVVEMDAARLPANALEQPFEIRNTEAVRDIRAGTPLKRFDIRPVIMVRKGQTVLLSVGSGAYQVAARVEAMQDGRLGEQIRLKNPESGRTLSGVVIGPNQLRGL